MKISNFISKATIFLFSLLSITLVSCTPSSTDPAVTTPPPAQNSINGVLGNTGALNLVAIDTAKIVKMTETGTSPVIVLNRKLNQNSYISDFCFKTDGTKFVYVEQQLSGIVPNLIKTVKLKIANLDGSNDTDLFTAQNALQGSSITSIRYCTDGKIFFGYKMYTSSGNASSFSYHTINADGTGDSTTTLAFGELEDVSNSRRFYIQNGVYPNATNRTTIYDTTLDNGAGTLLQENFSTTAQIGPGSFTDDNKYAVIPFKEANEIKLKIIDLATKLVTIKTILSGLTSGYVSFRFNMASDSVRGVLTITGQNYLKSKSYVFNTNTGVTSAPFDNNDENVLNVFPY